MDEASPVRGLSVDFSVEGDRARNIYRALGHKDPRGKGKVTAGLLAIFFGVLGAHKFYIGCPGAGFLLLLVNIVGIALSFAGSFFIVVVLWMVVVIEGIIYLSTPDDEFEQIYIVGKRPWF